MVEDRMSVLQRRWMRSDKKKPLILWNMQSRVAVLEGFFTGAFRWDLFPTIEARGDSLISSALNYALYFIPYTQYTFLSCISSGFWRFSCWKLLTFTNEIVAECPLLSFIITIDQLSKNSFFPHLETLNCTFLWTGEGTFSLKMTEYCLSVS